MIAIAITNYTWTMKIQLSLILLLFKGIRKTGNRFHFRNELIKAIKSQLIDSSWRVDIAWRPAARMQKDAATAAAAAADGPPAIGLQRAVRM